MNHSNLQKEQQNAMEKMTLLLSRRNNGFVARAKRKVYERYIDAARELGYTPAQAEAHWQDILDMARLNLIAE